jgi:hypothetical protein
MQVIRMLWTQEKSDFEGRYHHLRNAVANPKPIQQPHPPVWVGASGPLMLRQTARYADVWNWAGDALEDAVAAGGQLVELCREAGRDPAEVRWSAQFGFDGADPRALLAEIRPWHEAGFRELVISCAGPDPVRSAEVAAETVLPALRELG